MPDLTPAQSLAASLRNRDTLVAAAAGSGKTAVLVERIMRMITNKDTSRPVDIDRLLVVTFTEAAATEMRQRISSAISNALAANPGSERLARQSSLMSRASVSTIHSFCRKILKTYFYAAGLDPDFKIGDQTELELMKYQVIEDLFEEEYSAENNTPFYGLVDRFGGGKTKDGMLGELVIRIYEFLINSPFPEQSLAEYLSFFNGKTEPPWEGIINEEMNREFRGVLACAERAAGLCLLPGGPEKYAQALESDKRMIRLFMHKLEMGGLQAVYEAMAGMSYEKLASYKKDADVSEELKDAVKDIREIEIKKKLRGIRDTYFFKPPEDMARDIGKLGPVMEALGDLTLRFMAMYAEAKREKNVLDFSDLEHFCIKILVENDPETGETRPSAVAREISAGFDEIMIDEYQDSNAVQELILGAVARPGGRFMVGDVKQSIYKFRRANPGIFIDKYERFAVCEAETAEREKSSGNVIPLFGSPAHIGSESMGTPPLRSADVIRSIRATNSTSASPAPSGLRIDLSMNFRSRAGVIHAVNRVFERLMSRSVGEIDYDERAALYPGLAYEPADGMETEVLLIDAAQGKTAGDIDEDETGASAVTDFDDVPDANAENPEIELSRAELESGVIARRIREILGRGLTVTDQSDKRPRPVRYGDIAVLSRSIADISDIFERQFKRLGIPLAVESHTSFFESTEVLTALSFLRAVDNPRQDIHLAAVLLSPVYGFTTDELVAIRQTDREVCLYQCLLEKKEAGSVNEKIDSFLADLARWRDMAEYMPVSRLIGRIYEDTGLMSLAGAGNGASGQAALTALAEKAAAFEETTYKGL
ncbi:MAG: UvrD-helicase domain-containing protein, partial [Defluviitaleaceae bacterium]|nr:UvrD-helicase domain-containing protein [Defluviitaleaceae bacterium]